MTKKLSAEEIRMVRESDADHFEWTDGPEDEGHYDVAGNLQQCVVANHYSVSVKELLLGHISVLEAEAAEKDKQLTTARSLLLSFIESATDLPEEQWPTISDDAGWINSREVLVDEIVAAACAFLAANTSGGKTQ